MVEAVRVKSNDGPPVSGDPIGESVPERRPPGPADTIQPHAQGMVEHLGGQPFGQLVDEDGAEAPQLAEWIARGH